MGLHCHVEIWFKMVGQLSSDVIGRLQVFKQSFIVIQIVGCYSNCQSFCRS